MVVIKAQTQRSLAANQTAALARLQLLVDQAVTPLAARKPTKPTKASKRRRLQNKTQRGATKASRRLNVTNDS